MSSTLLNFSSQSQVTAGSAINQRDLVEINGYDGLASSCKITDYAGLKAISSGNSVEEAVAPTVNLSRNPLAVSINGFVFSAFYSTNTAPAPLQVQKYTPLMGEPSGPNILIVDPATAQMNSVQLLTLSNNTLAIVWSEGATSPYNIYYAIFDTNMNVIVAKTSVDAAATGNLSAVSNYSSRLGVSAAGFSIAYQSAASNTQIHFAAYDNSGNVIANGSATIIQTWGAVGSAALPALKLLPNGNLAYACVSGSSTAGSIGIFVGVVSSAGAIITAPANQVATTDAGITLQAQIEVAPSGTTFSVAGGISALKVAVFNLSAAIIGAQHTTGSAYTTNGFAWKLVYSAGQYNLIWTPSVGSTISLTQIPRTGTNYIEGIILSGTTSTAVMDAGDGQNMLIGIQATSATTCAYFVIGLPNINGIVVPEVYLIPTQFFSGASSSVPSLYLNLLIPGDFTFICAADFSSGSLYYVIYQKYAPTGISGVAVSGGVAMGTVPLSDAINSTQDINFLAGSPSVAFNMLSPTPPNVGGREGNLTNHTVAFSG